MQTYEKTEDNKLRVITPVEHSLEELRNNVAELESTIKKIEDTYESRIGGLRKEIEAIEDHCNREVSYYDTQLQEATELLRKAEELGLVEEVKDVTP